ncbi:CARDB domain-containing protein [Myxococcus sp. Y35]|uniref:CARDB domain-containing protein n=1 Tax=Pseudomyxococcus flavus TaxID=3115648 RepID=UPI003CFA8DF3
MKRYQGVSSLAALFILGGCEGALPGEPHAAGLEVQRQAGTETGLDLSVVDLAGSCEATALSISGAIKNEGRTGIAGSTAAVYAGTPGEGGVRLGTIDVPFLVGGEAFPFSLSFTVPEGTTRVTVVADEDAVYLEDDEANNVAVLDFEVPCATNQQPVASCQDVTVPADASCQGAASIDNGSFDPDGFPGPFSVSQSPEGPFGLGTTAVQLSVSDGAATNTCSANVTVVDISAPTPGANRGLVLQPTAGSDYVLVSLADCAMPAVDNCGGELDLAESASIIRVTSDESDDALSLLRLLACDDMQLTPDRKSVMLRAESALLGNGRVYNLTYSVRDASGNASIGTCNVKVPALLGNPAIDSGVRYCQGDDCPSGSRFPGLLCSLL